MGIGRALGGCQHILALSRRAHRLDWWLEITVVMLGALSLSPVSQFHGRVSLLEEVAP